MHCFRTITLAVGLTSLLACTSTDDSKGTSADAQAGDGPVTSDAASSEGDAGEASAPDATAETDATGTDGGETEAAPSIDAESEATTDGASSKTVLDLNDVKTNPSSYEWFDFRPNVKKLILAGAAETEHIAILWYTVVDGSVGLHYHSKTESVYAIDGTQTDGKGVYPTGTVYFNPPGSGHAISNSTGFFVLAYGAPPDFANTSLITDYTPVRIDTSAPDLTTTLPFEEKKTGVRVFAVPLVMEGGMSAAFIDTSSTEDYAYQGNYLLVIKGSCTIDGAAFGKNTLVVTKTVEPTAFAIAASATSACLAMGVSFNR